MEETITMTDEVIPESGLESGETMRVVERQLILPDGRSLWLRRFTLDPDGRRRWLSDGKWVAQLGGEAHLYASPVGLVSGEEGSHEWLYRAPHAFPTWQEAAEGGRSAAGFPAESRT